MDARKAKSKLQTHTIKASHVDLSETDETDIRLDNIKHAQ